MFGSSTREALDNLTDTAKGLLMICTTLSETIELVSKRLDAVSRQVDILATRLEKASPSKENA